MEHDISYFLWITKQLLNIGKGLFEWFEHVFHDAIQDLDYILKLPILDAHIDL